MHRLLILLALAACKKSSPAPTPVEPAPAPAPAPAVDTVMNTHFGEATQAVDAVIFGDLTRARRVGARLATRSPLEGEPDAWAGSLVAVRQLGAQLEQARDLPEAASAVAGLAGACGSCHTATGGGPPLRAVDTIVEATLPSAHMQKHVWATHLMWTGLVTPSEALFQRAADVLGTVPDEVRTDLVFVATDAAIHARAAAPVSSPEERQAMFADLIADCAACHTQRRDPEQARASFLASTRGTGPLKLGTPHFEGLPPRPLRLRLDTCPAHAAGPALPDGWAEDFGQLQLRVDVASGTLSLGSTSAVPTGLEWLTPCIERQLILVDWGEARGTVTLPILPSREEEPDEIP